MILFLSVILVLYLMVVFLIPFAQTAVFWISFVFTLVSICLTGAIFYLAFGKDASVKSRFYGFPLAKLGVIYVFTQLIAGLIFMALAAFVPLWVAVLVQAAILAAATLGLISADAVVEEIHIQDRKLKTSVATMRALQSRVSQMITMCDAPDASKALRKLSEELRYSDPVSAPQLEEIERDLWEAVDQLQYAIVSGSSGAIIQDCRACTMILAERNRLCKLYKG